MSSITHINSLSLLLLTSIIEVLLALFVEAQSSINIFCDKPTLPLTENTKNLVKFL